MTPAKLLVCVFANCLLFLTRVHHGASLESQKTLTVHCAKDAKSVQIPHGIWNALTRCAHDFEFTCGLLRYDGSAHSLIAALHTALMADFAQSEHAAIAEAVKCVVQLNVAVFADTQDQIAALMPHPPFPDNIPFKYAALKRVISIADVNIQKILGSGVYGDCFLVKLRNVTGSAAAEQFVLKLFKKPEEPSSLEFLGGTHLIGCRQISDYLSQVSAADNDAEIKGVLMRHAEHGSLASYIESVRPTFNPDLLIELLNLATGIENIHNAGFLHRDIKAANVLVYAHPQHPQRIQLRLSDFGLFCDVKNAKRFLVNPGKHDAQRDGIYFAPEMFSHKKPIGRASDWYAYGSLLEEVVARTTPLACLSVTSDCVGWLIAGLKTISFEERYTWHDVFQHTEMTSGFNPETQVVSEIFYRLPVDLRHIKSVEIGLVAVRDSKLQFYVKMRRMPNGCFVHLTLTSKQQPFEFLFVEHCESYAAIPRDTRVHFESLPSIDYVFDNQNECYKFTPEINSVCRFKRSIEIYVSASFNFYEKKAYFSAQFVPISSNRLHDMHIYLKGEKSHILVGSKYDMTDVQCCAFLESL